MINDRVQELVKISGLTLTDFASQLDVHTTVIFNIIRGRRSKPSFDLLQKILEQYDSLRAEWLVRGEGAMWSEDAVAIEDFAPSHVKLKDKIAMLFTELKVRYGDNSYHIAELEELVNVTVRESHEQKKRLVMLNERNIQIIKVLEDRLKIFIK